MATTTIKQPWTFNITPWQRQADLQGGDFYLVYRSEKYTRIIIGDVSGHGQDAAPFAAQLRPWIERRLTDRVTINTLRDWSKHVRLVAPDRFIAFTCIQIDRTNATAEIFAAGNPDIIIRKQDGSTRCIEANGMPLGLVKDKDWIPPLPQKIKIASNDEIVCFTDGLTDTTNITAERFGLNRVRNLIMAATHDCVAAIKSAHRLFADRNAAQDDLTLLRITPATALASAVAA